MAETIQPSDYENDAIKGAQLQRFANKVAAEIATKQDALTEMTTGEVQDIIDNIGSLT